MTHRSVSPTEHDAELEKAEVESKLALQFDTVHSMLDKILENIPLANSVLPEVLEQKLPSCFGPVSTHFQFVQNILKISGKILINNIPSSKV